ncbi:MAG: aminopeptidase P family protein [Dehalococcoidia bacterium]|nr:aminopeptidase P family protein [Dehalococcoidia bacterium]
METRLNRLRATMAEKNYDVMLVSQGENRRYMSGFTGSTGYLFIAREQALLLTDFRYTEQATLQAPEFEVRQVAGGLGSWLPDAVKQLGGKRVAFDENHVTYAMFQALTKAVADTGAELTPDSETVEMLRAVKEPSEIGAIHRAQDLTGDAYEHVYAGMHPGMTEQQVAWELEKYIHEHGGEGLAFETIVAAGPNAAKPHHHPTGTVIREGEPIVLDFGAKVDGYCADMTRTVCLGKQDDQFKKIYDLVLGAQLTAEALIKTGITGEEADGYARKVITDAGYGDNFGHSLGHGIGLYVHEYPRVAQRATNVLQDGMVFSNEPGVYITGWGGVRIEDLLTLEAGKVRNITKASKLQTA